jgi:uncharacterized membrane protein YdfJ with MMPL/SSD domain
VARDRVRVRVLGRVALRVCRVAPTPACQRAKDALATPDGVQLVSPPSINKAGDAATFTVIPTTRPADPKTADLVTQMRTSVIPPATGGAVTAYVGGVTAANVDLAAKISSQLLQLILVVLALSIVLRLVAFRSLLIPVQAVVTDLLCVGAAFGVLVATFQWGWGPPTRWAGCSSASGCR